MSGFYIPPRRNLDYTEFKIKNIDKEQDNFINKNELIFIHIRLLNSMGSNELKSLRN